MRRVLHINFSDGRRVVHTLNNGSILVTGNRLVCTDCGHLGNFSWWNEFAYDGVVSFEVEDYTV